MKINNIFCKILISLLIFLTLANFIGSINVDMNYSFAASAGEEKTNELVEDNTSPVGQWIINAIFKFPLVMLCRAIRSVNSLLASSGGVTGGASNLEISPFDIFFNRCTLLDANIFSTTDRDGNALDTNSIVYKIRSNAAIWYYAIRTIAIAIIAIMLLWNLIRAVSKNTSAEQKSVAKNALTDWVLSFALVMFMHIIVIIVLNFNDVLLQVIQSFTPYASSADFYDALENSIYAANLVLGFAGLIVYGLLNFQTIKYILVYIQRLLTIVLLVMISPIIPITYSTDRMRGGRGAALNGWLKELLFNVFVQVLHAIIYAALVSVAMAALGSSTSIVGIADLGTALIAIAAMLFIKYAERMLKSIFGFDASTVLNTNVFRDAATTVTNIAGTARTIATGGAPGVPAFGQNVGNGGMLGGIRSGGLGFGQNIGSGATTPSAGSFLGGIRQGFGVAANGLGGQGTMLGGIIDTARGNTSGELPRLAASAESSANASASAYAEASAENGKDGKDGKDSYESDFVAAGGESVDEALKDKQQDEKLAALRKGQDEERQNAEENMSAEDKKRAELEKVVREQQGISTETNNENETDELKENNNTVVNTEKTNEIIEEDPTVINTEETEVVEGEENAGIDPDILKAQIQEMMGGNLSPELNAKLEELLNNNVKPELLDAVAKAIATDDPELTENLKTKMSDQLQILEQKIGTDSSEEIINNINANWNNKEKRDEYINSLPEGSNEQKFAQIYTAMSALDDKDMPKSDRFETITTSGVLDKKSEVFPDTNAGSTSTMKIVNEKESNSAETTVVTSDAAELEVGPDPDIANIKDEHLRETMSQLAEIDPVQYRVNGKLDGEINNEIQDEFTATISEFTKKVGKEPNGIKDIYDNMDKEARKQFAQYKEGKIPAKDLRGDAKALAKLEIQARGLGYGMTVGENSTVTNETNQQFEYSIDGKSTKTSNNVNNIIIDLQAEREKRDKQKGKKLA